MLEDPRGQEVRIGRGKEFVHTPNTMPVGNMIPQVNVCRRICAHNIESCGVVSLSCLVFRVFAG